MSMPTYNCLGREFRAVGVEDYKYYHEPGVYILCRHEQDGSTTPLYVGEAENLATRLGCDHEKWFAARFAGMNLILIHPTDGTRGDRLHLETRLRHTYVPPLNDQPVPLNALLMDPSPHWAERFAYGLLTPIASPQPLNKMMQCGAMQPASRNALADALLNPEQWR